LARPGSAETSRRAISHTYSDCGRARRRSRLLCHPMSVGFGCDSAIATASRNRPARSQPQELYKVVS
jgi:hypothetical protein